MQTTPGTSLTEDQGVRRAAPRGRLGLWVGVAAVVYALDQGSKRWAETSLDAGVSHQVVGDWLQLRLTYNPGAAFSLGTGYTVVLTLIALAVIVVCVRMARRLGSVGWAVALGLLLGGALGNVTDRILRDPAPFRGHVVDFLQLPHWPVFNVADCAIVSAAVLFVLLSLWGIHLDGTVETGGRGPEPADPPLHRGSGDE